MSQSHLRSSPSFLALLTLGIVGLVGPAFAVPTLILTDSATGASVTVADEDAADTFQGEVGTVGFNGTVGVWTVNTSTGFVYGTTGSPALDLNSANRASMASTLTLQFSADGFGPSAGYFDVAFGGTVAKKGAAGNSSITLSTYWSPTNTLFSGILLTDYTYTNSASGSRGFSDNQTGSFLGASSYAITEVVVITHGAANCLSSFDAAIEVTDVPTVPDPAATSLLLGLSLLGVGLAGRLRSGRGVAW